MHTSPPEASQAPQTPKRPQQILHKHGSPSPAMQSVHHSSLTLEVSGHGLHMTTTANLSSPNLSSPTGMPQEDEYWSPSDDTFFRSDEFAQSQDCVFSPPNRYVVQNRSTNGKLAYVVFAGHDIGVFYNWTACSAATRGFSNKVFKGFTTYDEAHRVWRAFVDHHILPPDVITSLFGKAPPIPPTILPPNIGGFVNPSTPTAVRSPSTTYTGSPLKPILWPNIGHLANEAEDFWVVLTGVSPGVYQGRIEGERALGSLASPSFLRIGSRAEANQIFVQEYMNHRVARFS